MARQRNPARLILHQIGIEPGRAVAGAGERARAGARAAESVEIVGAGRGAGDFERRDAFGFYRNHLILILQAACDQ
jgi:hypothetical protein